LCVDEIWTSKCACEDGVLVVVVAGVDDDDDDDDDNTLERDFDFHTVKCQSSSPSLGRKKKQANKQAIRKGQVTAGFSEEEYYIPNNIFHFHWRWCV